MSKKKKELPAGISPEFIDKAITQSLKRDDMRLAFKSIPFLLHYRPINAPENEYGGALDYMGEQEAVIIETVGIWENSLPLLQNFAKKEVDKDDKPPFRFVTAEFAFENGIPYLMNAHLLDGCTIHGTDTVIETENPRFTDMLFAQPAYLPQTVIIDAFGNIHFAQQAKEELQKRLKDLITQLEDDVEAALPQAPIGPTREL